MPHSTDGSTFDGFTAINMEARDLVNARLTQARGVLAVLTAVPDESLFSHSAMMASLWAVATLLEQADAALTKLVAPAEIHV